ncbi:hypothetical protein M0R45_014670 [Rubus argutus]|uniref:Uncharacterized protein n=1 Tax=Rubus argutus TaxID=59490 RepID=A0AAW1XPT1_RUBAR
MYVFFGGQLPYPSTNATITAGLLLAPHQLRSITITASPFCTTTSPPLQLCHVAAHQQIKAHSIGHPISGNFSIQGFKQLQFTTDTTAVDPKLSPLFSLQAAIRRRPHYPAKSSSLIVPNPLSVFEPKAAVAQSVIVMARAGGRR